MNGFGCNSKCCRFFKSRTVCGRKDSWLPAKFNSRREVKFPIASGMDIRLLFPDISQNPSISKIQSDSTVRFERVNNSNGSLDK